VRACVRVCEFPEFVWLVRWQSLTETLSLCYWEMACILQ